MIVLNVFGLEVMVVVDLEFVVFGLVVYGEFLVYVEE